MKALHAVVGVSDHGGWAILVTTARDGTFLDRRRVELVDDDLPAIPYHHEGQLLPTKAAVALVERVRASAQRHATVALDTLAIDVPSVAGIALRVCPPLPPTIVERLADHHARNNADWVMYRQALANAATARGWTVCWFEAKTVGAAAADALHISGFDAYFAEMRRMVGAPWNADHKLALAAAIVAAAKGASAPTVPRVEISPSLSG